MSGHYPGFSSPNHQGNYPNPMVNQQMRNMPGVMGPMMNMQAMPNQMVNQMMGQQSMNYNQSAMPNPGICYINQFRCVCVRGKNTCSILRDYYCLLQVWVVTSICKAHHRYMFHQCTFNSRKIRHHHQIAM